MSTDVKLNKAQISKIIQSGRSFGFWSSKLGNDALTTIAIPFSQRHFTLISKQLSFKRIK